MAEVMLQLGDYPFGLDTAAYQRLRRVAEYRWPAQDRIGRDPALQYVGPGRQRIEETGTEHLPGGAPRKIDFRLELAFYGEDAPR